MKNICISQTYLLVSKVQPTIPTVLPTNPVATTPAPNIISKIYSLSFIDAATRYASYFNQPNSAAYKQAIMRYKYDVSLKFNVIRMATLQTRNFRLEFCYIITTDGLFLM